MSAGRTAGLGVPMDRSAGTYSECPWVSDSDPRPRIGSTKVPTAGTRYNSIKPPSTRQIGSFRCVLAPTRRTPDARYPVEYDSGSQLQGIEPDIETQQARITLRPSAIKHGSTSRHPDVGRVPQHVRLAVISAPATWLPRQRGRRGYVAATATWPARGSRSATIPGGRTDRRPRPGLARTRSSGRCGSRSGWQGP